MNIKEICKNGTRIPLEYRKNKEKAISLLKDIKDNNILIKNKDIYSLASWANFKINNYDPKDSFSEVEEIKYTENKPTYDMHIKEKNSYVANGIICHNTINLPNNATIDDVSKIYKAAWKYGCKGITVYRDGCRSGVLINKDNKDNNSHITQTNAPKRPKIVSCDVYHPTVKGQKYFVIIGLLNEKEPYEIFAGKNDEFPQNIKEGCVKKKRRGVYQLCDLEDNDKIIYENISYCIDEEQEAMTRLISASLRHGCNINFIVHQLEKTEGDLMGFAKAVCRILKKYIPENSEVKGEECQECGSKLARKDGCIQCISCGWSKC